MQMNQLSIQATHFWLSPLFVLHTHQLVLTFAPTIPDLIVLSENKIWKSVSLLGISLYIYIELLLSLTIFDNPIEYYKQII
jgi:hypothetical protein